MSLMKPVNVGRLAAAGKEGLAVYVVRLRRVDLTISVS
jgi:hypothetical protein